MFCKSVCLDNVIIAIARSWDIEILIPLILLRRIGAVMYFVDSVIVDFEKVCFL